MRVTPGLRFCSCKGVPGMASEGQARIQHRSIMQEEAVLACFFSMSGKHFRSWSQSTCQAASSLDTC